MNRKTRKARRIGNANRVRAMYPDLWREFGHLPLNRSRIGVVRAKAASLRPAALPILDPEASAAFGSGPYDHYFDPAAHADIVARLQD